MLWALWRLEGAESLELSDKQIRHLQLLASQAAERLNLRHRVTALETENAELLIQELGVEMAEEKYRSIFEHVQEGIFQTTREGAFISANPMLAKIYGFESTDDLMANLNDISRPTLSRPGTTNGICETHEQA